MEINKWLALGIILFVLIAVILSFVITAGNNTNSGDSNFDKCKPQSGYTEESWKEHMDHHPEQYEECLK